jgi:hypothetical protein
MARARVDRSHPVNVLAAIERLTEVDQQVLRLVAEHEVMSTEQLAAVCFPAPARFADAAERLRYLATRALLVRFPHPGTHPAGLPADELASRPPAGLPRAVSGRWGDVVLLVMVNDNRERQLHRRWLGLTAAVSRCRRSPPPPTASCGPGPRRRSGGR